MCNLSWKRRTQDCVNMVENGGQALVGEDSEEKKDDMKRESFYRMRSANKHIFDHDMVRYR